MRKQHHLKRRRLLKGMAATSLIPLLGSNLIGCSDNSDGRGAATPTTSGRFLHGIASGDPLSDRVIIWTRITPEEEGVAGLDWQVAEDAEFSKIIASGSGTTDASVDYTVKVDVTGLEPAMRYFYRFTSGENTSATGRTRTLPVGQVASADFAVVSCSNHPAGYFHVYREVAQLDLDAVLHLGDYIYEYGATGYGSDTAEELGRVVDPLHEIVSLSDYRRRYAQYHTDSDLQAAHAAHPFIVVWDDHEITNNSWRDGAQNHQPDTEGSYDERKQAAVQAWYEWLPVRPPATQLDVIYRHFAYGDLLDLFMLDTRIIGRDEQYTYADFTSDGKIDVEGARAAFNDSNRELLGSDQREWLRSGLSGSSANWQVLGQQVLLGRYHLPAPIMEVLDRSSGSGDALSSGVAAVLAAVAAKGKTVQERSEEEQALLDSALPFNLDAWDGYAFERDELLRFARQLGAKLVTLAGDTHSAWSSQLTTPEGDIAGVEFGCTSVSSPGLESELGAENAVLFGPIVPQLIDDLVHANLANRGYLHVSFSEQHVIASQRFISGVGSNDYSVLEDQGRTFTVKRADMLLS